VLRFVPKFLKENIEEEASVGRKEGGRGANGEVKKIWTG
jgi:hypothetical protein